jgi:cell division septum initiation protein DivIVA
MLDVRIPIKNRKLTLNDVVDMMLDGFNKVNGRLDVIETDIHQLKEDVSDLKVRVTNLETRMTNVENFIVEQKKLNERFIDYMDKHP